MLSQVHPLIDLRIFAIPPLEILSQSKVAKAIASLKPFQSTAVQYKYD